MIQIILAAVVFFYGVYGICALVGYLLMLMKNGFNFRQTSRELEFIDGIATERREQKKLEDKQAQEEYLAKRRDRLGY